MDNLDPLGLAIIAGLGTGLVAALLVAIADVCRRRRTVTADRVPGDGTRWLVTAEAVEHYRRTRGWPEDNAHQHRAINRLRALAEQVTHHATDEFGRQLWRAEGTERLWMVVGPAPGAGLGFPRLLWVGRARPPPWAWKPSE